MNDFIDRVKLRSVLAYEPNTGIFVWLIKPSKRDPAGMISGTSKSDGRRQIRIYGRLYYAHRLAWLYMTGEWPKHEIDHINGIRDDNRLCNLRDTSVRVNNMNRNRASKNNAIGLLGVSQRSDGRFQADIRVNKKKVYLGSFDKPEDAYAAYLGAKKKFHAEALS